jgi:predicted nuclease with TOPRIM domain
MLNVSDQEIEFFKNDVNNYNNIEQEIKDVKKKLAPLQEKLRELTKRKEEKQKEVLYFMQNNELDVCNTDDASYEVKTTKNTKQVSKADAYEKLLKFFESEKYSEIKDLDPEGKARFIHNYVYVEGREVSNKVSLKSK